MSDINKKFSTKYTTVEMKNYISTKLLPNPALGSLLEHTEWNDNILFIRSKIGNGQIILQDYLVEINIKLSIFGSLTKRGLEAALDKEFKQLK